MTWKRLTFVLIPHSRDTIKQFRVHRVVLYGTALFLLTAVGIMIFYIIGFNGKEFNTSRTRALLEKNVVLEKEIAVFDSSLTHIETRVAHLESLNTSIIEESGISEMDLEQFGQNGVKNGTIENDMNTDIILGMIHRLDKESEAFEYNYSSLFSEFMKKPVLIRSIPSIRPSRGTITREFGNVRDTLESSGEKAHPGVDITWDEGTPVVATADGVIEESDTNKELGKYILIDHQNGYKTRYAHLQPLTQMKDKIRINVGDKVQRGDLIGAIGRTGISIAATPSHIMYTVYHNGIPVNPVDYFFASDLLAASIIEENAPVQNEEPPSE